MPIKSEIIADSISQNGCRATTYILEYPRFIHSELLTHRAFSKNAASSRAIPFEKFVQQITENPAMPEFWGKNQSGMQAVEELDDASRKADMLFSRKMSEYSEHYAGMASGIGALYCYNLTDREKAKAKWLEARDSAIGYATQLNKLGCHKQIVNRILEPWFHIRVIFSGTDYENFFALRAHKDAQPEFRVLAEKMLEEYNKSTPKLLKEGEWHIPFGDKIDEDKLSKIIGEPLGETYQYYRTETLKKIAVARCARVSYFNYEGKDDYEADIKLCDRLFGSIPRHLSPTEHVAMCMNDEKYYGNMKGFKQYRKFFLDENLKDPRITAK